MNPRITILQGDITQLKVDAIVNAANSSLLGGGGVDGAIHRAAGPELLHACRLLGGCKTGDAKITRGFDLPAEYIIHTVGPVWNGGNHQEDRLLASCYQKSLELAVSHQIVTVAFPAISTGIYGFPLERSTNIAIRQINDFLSSGAPLHEVTLVAFGERDYIHMLRIAEATDSN